MFDIGFLELLVIGIVALIVVGPKDLPGMFRQIGRFTAKARSMAREFSRAMEAAADETGMGDVAKDLKTMTSSKNLGLDAVKDVASDMAKWSPDDAMSGKTVGPETAKLTQERAEAARKIREAAAEKAQARLDREAAAEAAAWEEDDPGMVEPETGLPQATAHPEDAPPTAPEQKPAAKKSAARKPASRKTSARKPTGKPAGKSGAGKGKAADQ